MMGRTMGHVGAGEEREMRAREGTATRVERLSYAAQRPGGVAEWLKAAVC